MSRVKMTKSKLNSSSIKFDSKANLNPTPLPTKKQYTIGDYQIESKIGQGAFGKVFLGAHIPTKEKVAIKILIKEQLSKHHLLSHIENEIQIHKRLHHESIVRYYSVIETKATMSMITEYCPNGELFAYISTNPNKKLSEKESCRLFQQLISGIDYLHHNNISHRDIKLDNLLLSEFNQLKIIDFGLSKVYNDVTQNLLSTQCGSPCYVAPEIVLGKQYSGEVIDIWSSGIVLYSMLCGHFPFYEENQKVLFDKITKGDYTIPSFLTSACIDLIKRLLCVDPKKRITISQIRQHSWFSLLSYPMSNIISPGLFLNRDVIPIDELILAEIEKLYQLDIKETIVSIILNKHNELTVTYYLHLQQKIRNKQTSVSDVSSTSKAFVEYIQSDKSKLSHFGNKKENVVKHYKKYISKNITIMKKQISNWKIEENRNELDKKEMDDEGTKQQSIHRGRSNARRYRVMMKTKSKKENERSRDASIEPKNKIKRLGGKCARKSVSKIVYDIKLKEGMPHESEDEAIDEDEDIDDFVINTSTIKLSYSQNESNLESIASNDIDIMKDKYINWQWKRQKILFN